MAQVCKWLSFYLCVRDSPKSSDTVHPDFGHPFDAIVVWKETQKEKPGGLSYDVILKPASAETAPRPPSPPKERPISQEFIEKKLKEAEERRLSVEAARLSLIAKDKERAQEANKRIANLNDSFSKQTEQKLKEKLESMGERKNQQIKALQDKLQEHAKRVMEVRKVSDDYTSQLKERISRKMENYEENRQAQLKVIQERLRDHEKHVNEVIESSSKFSKLTEEKIIQKMESRLKNREDQLNQLRERLAEHEKHSEEVRKNKLDTSATEPDGVAEKS